MPRTGYPYDVKSLFLAAVCGALATSLAGCGSSAPPSLAVSCTTRTLASGLIRARVTVTNTTPNALRAIVYGPALRNTHFIHPRHRPTEVYVKVGNQRRSYVGFVIPSVGPRTPAHVVFQLAKLPYPQPILATAQAVVHADSWDEVSNKECRIT
jgi:hypothetical protein